MLPAHPLDGLLSAFNNNNSLFVLGTPDGRVRTYDTVTGRLRSSLASGVGPLAAKNNAEVPSGHLAEGHKCLVWVDSEGSSSSGQARSWVAVGTSSGAVKLYDSATGEVKWQATNCNEGGVDCLAHTPGRASVLLCSGQDGQLCRLDTATGSKQGQTKGSKHAVTAAALSADGSKLIFGGTTLSLWDMDTQQRISRLTGHPLPVCALAFAPSGGFALSAAEGERLVAVWATPGRQASKKKGGAVAAASLAVEQPVVGLATAVAEAAAAGCFYAAAVTESGEAYLWLIRPLSDTAVDNQQLAHICIGSRENRNAGGECVLAAGLDPSPDGVTLLLAAGTPAKPRFQRVPISSSAGASNKITFLSASAADGLIRPAGAANGPATANGPAAAPLAGSRDVEMLGADNAGEAVQQRVSSKSSRKRQEPEPEAAAAAAGDADAAAGLEDEDEDMDAGEATLGQRVAELEQQQLAGAVGTQQQQKQQQAATALPPGPVKADSLSVLLTQALRSSDRALLEQCLGVSNERVIANSVKRLLPLDAALLLRAAVERLQSKPARGQQMAAWIHAVLLHHTAYLMAAPGAAPVMSSLYQIIESRLAMQRQLLSLAGRLELLLAQAGGQQAEAAATDAVAGPRVVYQESDSEAEVEVVDAAADLEDDEEGDYYTDDEGEDDDKDEDDSEEDEEDD